MPIFTGKLSEKNHPCAIFSSKMKHATIEKKQKQKQQQEKTKIQATRQQKLEISSYTIQL